MSDASSSSESASMELLRVWIEGESLQCALQADAFDDAGEWGAVLADVVRNIAGALETDGTPAEQIVQRIVEVFQQEVRSPASE